MEVVRALHHLHDFAVCAPVSLQPLDADRYTVAVHGAVGVFFTQVDVAFESRHRLFRSHKPVAVAMHAQPPVNQARRFLLLRVAPLEVTFRM